MAHIIYRLDIGGLENGLVNLINEMPAKRYRHAIICLEGVTNFRDRLRRNDVELVALHKRNGKDPATYLRLWRVLKRLRPDVVHTRNLGAVDATLIAALAGVPRRIHGEHGWDMVDLHGTRARYVALRRVCRSWIDHYVTVSNHLAGWLQHRIGVPRERITQIYNGVDTAQFRPAVRGRETLPCAFGKDENIVVIGSVGRMQHVKDPLTLVDAFLRLREISPRAWACARLVMVGDGPLRSDALARLQQTGASDRAWLPGARHDVPALMRGFDVFVLPSLNEGISNTILEAMASGLPVVATDVGGNAELVRHGETGRLVPASEPEAMARALAAYVEARGRRQTHGEAARTRAEQHFGLQTMVNRYQATYDAVLGVNSRTVRTAPEGC
ncbi:MAG: TIGR03088 family PEP-CTERM/XrtA system glycosyltransferase [Gammaproteobacteria bacterium]